jgi:glycyl-radical enzyme activating protein
MAGELTAGTIFDIQGFSVHDGPGCRTVVFLKGCPLKCCWCANPEGIHPWIEPMFNHNKCRLDHYCADACSASAITFDSVNLTIDRTRCATCLDHACRLACHSGALSLVGKKVTVAEVLYRLGRERPYWGNSGGITLSGGEPFAQPEFAVSLLSACHEAWIHTAAETCGFIAWENISPSLPFLDWLFFDLKLVTDVNPLVPGFNPMVRETIVENAHRLIREFKGNLVFRMPYISGVTDSIDNLNEIIRTLKILNTNTINLLPGHHLGRDKYRLVGKSYYSADLAIPSNEQLTWVQDQFLRAGITCFLGADTPF